MDKNENRKYLAIAFIAILIIVVTVSTIGILALKEKPDILQGQVEATEIKISGKLSGRIENFFVEEGQYVSRGDTLVLINSPEFEAKYHQANAMENVAFFQNQKVQDGTRKEIIATYYEAWLKSKSDLQLAETTNKRIQALYKDSVVTSQRKDETEALYRAAVAGERAAYQQYKMVLDGAQAQDRESSKSLVSAARSTVTEVEAFLEDARLIAPESGQIAVIYPKRGELVAPGTPIMSLVVLEDAHAVLNVREDNMPYFKIGGRFSADIPAIDKKGVEFQIYYISPLGSYATWKSTKQVGSYDMRTFEIKAKPIEHVADLRPGMSVLVTLDKK